MFLKILSKFVLLSTTCFLFQNVAEARANQKLSFEMLAPYTYGQLTVKQQKEYIDQIRKAWLTFEKNYPTPKVESASMFQRLFFETADAENPPECIIGGAKLSTIKVGGKYVCPTKGRPCKSSNPDGFLCGLIFGESTCVDRNPISNLSQRCYEVNASKPVEKKYYEAIIPEIAKNFEAVCSEKTVTNKDGCRILADKMNEISAKENIRIAELDNYNKNPIAATNSATETASSAKNSFGLPICSTGVTDKKLTAWWLPSFKLPENISCPYQSNQNLLTRLGQNGCSRKDPLTSMFTTGFTTTDNSLLFGQSSFVEGVVENISVVEKKSPSSTVYNVQMLLPNTTKSPIEVERKNLSLRHDGLKFYVLNPHSQAPQEVKVANTNRTTIWIDNVPTTGKQIEGKTWLADNCMLAQKLKENGFYQSASITPAPSGTAGGSK